jgi:hypothetical protein
MSDQPTVENDLGGKIRQIIKAPSRSKVMTADIAVGFWSSTTLAEKVHDIEALIASEVRKARMKEARYAESYNDGGVFHVDKWRQHIASLKGTHKETE